MLRLQNVVITLLPESRIAFETALVALLQRRREDPVREAAAHKIIELAKETRSDFVKAP